MMDFPNKTLIASLASILVVLSFVLTFRPSVVVATHIAPVFIPSNTTWPSWSPAQPS